MAVSPFVKLVRFQLRGNKLDFELIGSSLVVRIDLGLCLRGPDVRPELNNKHEIKSSDKVIYEYELA